MGSFHPKITPERIAAAREFLPADWPRGDFVPFRNGRIDWAKIGIRDKIGERQKWRCHWCGNPMRMKMGSEWYPTIDHIVPLSKGGSDHPDNIVLAHRICNEYRGAPECRATVLQEEPMAGIPDDENIVKLTPKAFDEFKTAVDGPAAANGALKELLASPGFGTEGGGLASMDVEAFLNVRDWLQGACEAKGAKMTGGGIGYGQADIDIELEGCRYNISIKPLAGR